MVISDRGGVSSIWNRARARAKVTANDLSSDKVKMEKKRLRLASVLVQCGVFHDQSDSDMLS